MQALWVLFHCVIVKLTLSPEHPNSFIDLDKHKVCLWSFAGSFLPVPGENSKTFRSLRKFTELLRTFWGFQSIIAQQLISVWLRHLLPSSSFWLRQEVFTIIWYANKSRFDGEGAMRMKPEEFLALCRLDFLQHYANLLVKNVKRSCSCSSNIIRSVKLSSGRKLLIWSCKSGICMEKDEKKMERDNLWQVRTYLARAFVVGHGRSMRISEASGVVNGEHQPVLLVKLSWIFGSLSSYFFVLTKGEGRGWEEV